jgi:hypothetical protein
MTRRPEESDPARSVSLDVEAAKPDDLIDRALDDAVRILREDRRDLYAAEVGRYYPTGRSKYRPHLGVQGHPIGWRAHIVVRLRPEVVKARRGEQQNHPRRGGLHSVD